MNKRVLVETVASRADLPPAAAEAALEAIVAVIVAALADGDNVTIPGFGTFEVRARAARTGRNPQTGEPLQIAASKAPAFKPATAFKAVLNT